MLDQTKTGDFMSSHGYTLTLADPVILCFGSIHT